MNQNEIRFREFRNRHKETPSVYSGVVLLKALGEQGLLELQLKYQGAKSYKNITAGRNYLARLNELNPSREEISDYYSLIKGDLMASDYGKKYGFKSHVAVSNRLNLIGMWLHQQTLEKM